MKRYLQILSRLQQRLVYEWKHQSWQLICRFQREKLVDTANGKFLLQCKPRCPINRDIYFYGGYQQALIEQCLGFLRDTQRLPPKGQGTVLDVGANNGISCISMLHKGEFARAIAFEPEPDNYRRLCANIALNGLEQRIQSHNLALSNDNTRLQMELSSYNLGDHRVRSRSPTNTECLNESQRQTVNVASRQLDSLLDAQSKKDIVLMWIDVQGHEPQVFEGAKSLLKSGIPVVTELWPYAMRRSGTSDQQYFELVRELWTHYWVFRHRRFIAYPVETMPILFEELAWSLRGMR